MAFDFAGQYGPELLLDPLTTRPQRSEAVSVFEADGVTLAPLWQDRLMTTVLANPTSTDTVGNLTFFAVPGAKRVSLGGSSLAVTVPVDPVEADLASGDIGVVYVKDFGAVGDGVADDTAAIQAAVAALGGAPGRIMWERGRRHLLTDVIDIGGIDYVHLVGNGCTLLRDTHLADPTVWDQSSAAAEALSFFAWNRGDSGAASSAWDQFGIVEGFTFENIGNVGAGATTDAGYYTVLNGSAVTYNRRENKQVNRGAAVTARNLDDLTVRDCSFRELGYGVIHISAQQADRAEAALIDNCRFVDWANSAAVVGGEGLVQGCRFVQSAPSLSSTDRGNDLGTEHGVYCATGQRRARIVHNTFVGVRYYAVQVYSGSGVISQQSIVAHNIFRECQLLFVANSLVGAVKDVAFDSNTCIDCGQIVGLNNAGSHMYVRDNVVRGRDPNGAGVGSPGSARFLQGTAGSYTVDGNVIRNRGNTPSNVAVMEFTLDAALGKVRVRRNLFEDDTEAPEPMGTAVRGVAGAASLNASVHVIDNEMLDCVTGVSFPTGTPSKYLRIARNYFRVDGTGVDAPPCVVLDNTFEVDTSGTAVMIRQEDANSLALARIRGNRIIANPRTGGAFKALDVIAAVGTGIIDWRDNVVDRLGTISANLDARAFDVAATGSSVSTTGARLIEKTDVVAVTALTGGSPDQVVTLIANHASGFTLAHGATIKLAGSASFVMVTDARCTLIYRRGVWYEIGRTTP